MQPRFAALLFVLGLVDLAYVNLGLAHEVFADEAPLSPEPAAEPDPAPPAEPDPVAPESAPVPDPAAPVPEPAAPMLAAPIPPAAAPAVPPGVEATPRGEPPPGAMTPSPMPGSARAGVSPELPPRGTPPSQPPASEPAFAPTASELILGFPDKAASSLTGRAREELLALAARLRAHPEERVHIVGHADARGSREFNRDLGGRRARAVSELLIRAGVAREQLETESRGEDEPRIAGTSERVWAANRRVEISIGSERNETP
jgi:outer membrane protein OmpA-like peptidoglycan-associated protein